MFRVRTAETEIDIEHDGDALLLWEVGYPDDECPPRPRCVRIPVALVPQLSRWLSGVSLRAARAADNLP